MPLSNPWMLLGMFLFFANVPFVANYRFKIFSPHDTHRKSVQKIWKPFPRLLTEMVFCFAFLMGLTYWLEHSQGPVFRQSLSFYAIVFSFYLVCAFPGFAFRFLYKPKN